MNVIVKSGLVIFFGSEAALARAAGISRQAVNQWPEDKPIPPGYEIKIESASDGRVSRHLLNPYLYPTEPWCRCLACSHDRETNGKKEEAA